MKRSGVFTTPLTAEPHMDCRGSQRGSREISSPAAEGGVLDEAVEVGIEKSGPIWAMLHFGLAAGGEERCKDDWVDA